ncbi:unnamed protein product [Microthlaspi erraticum]|uniref:Uncharacterized protein n=1 Tax=Microthlaspi erraticum TaxID=1685480 RepID=A0A6D2I7H2_9BRAS|nr:unnamed protein product [Microthlaspi erraticum]CAA7046298.1 unnamed protein product [Microthlaspi erraticum]
MKEERAEPNKGSIEKKREKWRQRDRHRRQSMSQEEREKHLAQRRRNYQLRKERAELSLIDFQSQSITGGNQAALTSPPETGASSVPLVESDEIAGIPEKKMAKLLGPIRLSRVKHIARNLSKFNVTSVQESKGE